MNREMIPIAMNSADRIAVNGHHVPISPGCVPRGFLPTQVAAGTFRLPAVSTLALVNFTRFLYAHSSEMNSAQKWI
jgi:hypothetical protein